MRKITIILLSLFFVLMACTNNIVDKPKNLIAEDVMINIFYDLSIIEASKNIADITIKEPIQSNDYVLRKYKIDSLQFAQSNKFYAANPKKYRKMFQSVIDKLTEKDAELTKKLSQKK